MDRMSIESIDAPRIDPVPASDLPPCVSQAMERLIESGVLSSTMPVRVWAHRPETALAWLTLMETFYVESSLNERLRELIRLRIAAVTNCEACKLSRKSDTVTDQDIACIVDDDPRFTIAERAAMDFAARLAGDHDTINDQTFSALNAAFTTEQIVEINLFAALMVAGGRMTFAQKAY